MDMNFTPAAAHPLPPGYPNPPAHAVVLRGAHVPGGSLPRSLVDSCGGVALCLPEAGSVVLDTPGLYCVDLLDCPQLESVDLTALGNGVHLTVRGCPRLAMVRLAEHARAHVHVDAGAAPPQAFSISGAVVRIDACWGRDGRFMRQARRGAAFQGLHFGTETPCALPPGPPLPLDLAILIRARPDDARTGVLTLGPGLEACRDVCLVEPDDALLAVDWAGGALREFCVEAARGLMVLRLPARVEHLQLSACPRLRAVTTEGEPAGAVTLRECCTVDTARADGGSAASTGQRPAPGAPRVRASLVVDVPCDTLALLDCGFESLRKYKASEAESRLLTTPEAIFARVGDLAGVRIATYEERDREAVTRLLEGAFAGPGGVAAPRVEVKNKHEADRSNFYRATHCQVVLPAEELVGLYDNLKGLSCEVQVCSMLAHVWNEIEHNLRYKQLSGSLSADEQELIQQLGHLTIAGDTTIRLLIAAVDKRQQSHQGEFTDTFDFVARLRDRYPALTEFGRHAQQLYEESRARGLHSPARVEALFAGERIEDLQAAVDGFNQWLQSNGGREPGYLARNGADVLLMALLRDSSQEIVDRHPAGRGQGRPPRIAWLARRYLAMRGAV